MLTPYLSDASFLLDPYKATYSTRKMLDDSNRTGSFFFIYDPRTKKFYVPHTNIIIPDILAAYAAHLNNTPQSTGGNEYGRPVSDALWLLSASSSISKVRNEELRGIEHAYRKGNITPRSVNINTGEVTWVNPKYAKNIKWAGFLGTGGDIANITGVSYNIAFGEGWTVENIFDGIFGVVGFVPVAGDFSVLIYESMKWQVKNPEQAFRHQLLLKH
jgi:hypothetical protein